MLISLTRQRGPWKVTNIELDSPSVGDYRAIAAESEKQLAGLGCLAGLGLDVPKQITISLPDGSPVVLNQLGWQMTQRGEFATYVTPGYVADDDE